VSDWLFETPWWLPTLIVAVGVFLLWNGNRLTNSKLTRAGAAACLLAVLLVIISALVNTPKERAIAGSKKLINSFEKRDWTSFQSVLAPDVSVTLLNDPQTIYPNRQTLVAAAKDAQDRYNFSSVRITSMSAVQADTLISVNIDIITVQEKPVNFPVTSAWRFEWQEAADGWALERIIALKIANQSVDRVRPMFPNPAP
jgi:hypothetical protein